MVCVCVWQNKINVRYRVKAAVHAAEQSVTLGGVGVLLTKGVYFGKGKI